MEKICTDRMLDLRHTVGAVLLGMAMISFLAYPARAAGMTEGWTRVVTGGFTDRNNSYAPASIEFKSYLYLSTAATPAGFMFSKSEKVGGDIWRTADGVTWEQIGRPGLGNSHNASFNFVSFHDKLYALANNINDHGVEVWVSDDGEKFTPIETSGFGHADNNWAQGYVFNDHLLVLVSGAAGGPQIEVSDDGRTFQQVVGADLHDGGNTGFSTVREQPLLGGEFYLGTSNPSTGGEIWRTTDGLQWERVAQKGLERSSNTSLNPFLVFGGELYALGISSGSLEKLKGLEVYRSADGKDWQRIVSDGFKQGKERNVTGSLTEFKGRLYLTTNTMDPRILLPGHPTERMAPRGFQLRVSDDGENWTQIGKDGFGAPTTLYAVMNVIGDTAYLSAFDYHAGSQIWRSTDGQQWELIFREPDPSFFAEGGGVFVFDNHLMWLDHDLANGLEIWRSNAEVSD